MKSNEQPQELNLISVCHSLLRIVASFAEKEYTEENQRQTGVHSHSDPATPANGQSSQG